MLVNILIAFGIAYVFGAVIFFIAINAISKEDKSISVVEKIMIPLLWPLVLLS